MSKFQLFKVTIPVSSSIFRQPQIVDELEKQPSQLGVVVFFFYRFASNQRNFGDFGEQVDLDELFWVSYFIYHISPKPNVSSWEDFFCDISNWMFFEF